MNHELLDQWTMWSAFFYGAGLFLFLEIPFIQKVGEKYPELFLILKRHQPLALLCFWCGGLWILTETI